MDKESGENKKSIVRFGCAFRRELRFEPTDSGDQVVDKGQLMLFRQEEVKVAVEKQEGSSTSSRQMLS